ncbi:MAG: hypothetical protein R3E89_07320 [Thiolinea sp.]
MKYGLPQDQPGHGTQYLLGQGLYHFRDGYGRSSAVLSGQLHLDMALKPGVSVQQKHQLVQPLRHWVCSVHSAVGHAKALARSALLHWKARHLNQQVASFRGISS